MYGLIHNAVRAMVKDDLGDEAWLQISKRAGVSEEDFLSLKSYDDAVMLRILDAISSMGDIALEDVLYRFGLYFIRHTAFKYYGGVLNSYGTTLWALLANLNHMHDRMTSSFPEYRPPTFSLVAVANNHYELQYISERQGLMRFVEGLIDGLAEQFDVELNVTVLEETLMEAGQQTRFLLVPVTAHD